MSAQPPKPPEFIALIAMLTALTAFSIDAVLPALRHIADALSVIDHRNTHLIVPMFILGMVFGELLFGPLSDAIGRKAAILAGLAVYAAGTLVAMTAPSLELVLLGRLIQGFGVSGPKIGSRALIRDLYQGEAMARMMSFIFALFILVPMIAPSIGQFVLLHAGWRAIFVLFLCWSAVAAVWLIRRQPETLPGNRRIPLSFGALLRNGTAILGHGKVMACTMVAGLMFGAQLLFLSTAQAMFIDLYDAEDRFPVYFAILAFGIGIAFLCNGYLVTRFGMFRLCLAALAGLLATSLLHLALAALYAGVPPFAAFLALFFAMLACLGFVMGNINAMAMQSLGQVAGIGASLIASLSSLIAVIVAVSLGALYRQTVVPTVSGFAIAAVLSALLLLAAERSRAGEIADRSRLS